jgi:hypothetical protein
VDAVPSLFGSKQHKDSLYSMEYLSDLKSAQAMTETPLSYVKGVDGMDRGILQSLQESQQQVLPELEDCLSQMHKKPELWIKSLR